MEELYRGRDYPVVKVSWQQTKTKQPEQQEQQLTIPNKLKTKPAQTYRNMIELETFTKFYTFGDIAQSSFIFS